MDARKPWVKWGLVFLLAAWGGAFGIAVAVQKWWSESDYITCVTRVQEKYLDLWESHRSDQPVSPDAPSSSASQATWDAYSQQWAKYEKDSDAWSAKQRDLDQGWIDETRDC